MPDEDQLTNQLASLKIDRGHEDAPVVARRSSSSSSASIPWGAILGVLFVAAAGGVGYMNFDRVKARLFAPEVEVGQVSLVSPSQGEVTLVATGYVVAVRKATVSARVPGRLSRLLVKEGDHIKEGQLVAELEHSDIEAQLRQGQADLASARARVGQVKAELADAERRARREIELLGKGAGTQAAVDDAAAHVVTVKAQVAASEAEIETSAARVHITDVALGYTHIKAPFDGTVVRKLAELGDMVTPSPGAGAGAVGAGGIINIATLDDMEVEADVSETQLEKILPSATKDEVTGQVRAAPASSTPAEIVLDAFPERRFRGKLAEIRPTVDRSKATVTAKVRFVDPADGVLPDMSAKVSFLAKPIDRDKLAEAPKRVMPSDAVVDRDGRKVAFVVDGELARSVAVAVKGPLGTGQVEITDGPAVGAQVIHAPPPDLRDGANVKLASH